MPGVFCYPGIILLFQLLQPFQRGCAAGAQFLGQGHQQPVHQCGRGGHGVVFLFRPPIGEQIDVRRLIRRQAGAAHKGQGGVACGAPLLQQDAALPAELGKAEQHRHIAFFRARQTLQQLGAGGGQQPGVQPQTAQPEVQQPGKTGRGVFAVDVDPACTGKGGHRPVKFRFVQLGGGGFQAGLLAGQPVPGRKAAGPLQGAGQLYRPARQQPVPEPAFSGL